MGWFGMAVALGLGLSVGSFGNVLIYRLPLERLSILKPARSFCPSCKTQLTWRDNVPVLGWLLLRGRCRHCNEQISARYPLIELIVGLLFAWIWWLQPPVDTQAAIHLAVMLYLATTCVVISAIDLEHTIIPDRVTLPGMAVGVLLSVAFPFLHAEHPPYDAMDPRATALLASLGGALAGGGSLWLFGKLGNLMLARQMAQAGVEDAMGFGDVKWMAFAGTLLGPLLVLDAILAACFVGAIVGLLAKLVAALRRTEAPPGMPFGPFLSMGILAQLMQPNLAWDFMQRLAAGAL